MGFWLVWCYPGLVIAGLGFFLVPQLLEIRLKDQTGRVAKNATNVATHNFTEGWFRNSAHPINPY